MKWEFTRKRFYLKPTEKGRDKADFALKYMIDIWRQLVKFKHYDNSLVIIISSDKGYLKKVQLLKSEGHKVVVVYVNDQRIGHPLRAAIGPGDLYQWEKLLKGEYGNALISL